MRGGGGICVMHSAAEGEEGGEPCRNGPAEKTCDEREILHSRAYKRF